MGEQFSQEILRPAGDLTHKGDCLWRGKNVRCFGAKRVRLMQVFKKKTSCYPVFPGLYDDPGKCPGTVPSPATLKKAAKNHGSVHNATLPQEK